MGKTFKLKLTPLARIDLIDARNWYNKQQRGLGKRFINSVNDSLARILQGPEIFAIRYKNIHTAPVKDFPYLVHYIIDQAKNYIIVLSILHTSRDPREWDNRAE